VEEARTHNRILAGCTEALVRAAGPRGERVGKGAGAEPGLYLLRVRHRSNEVGTVSAAAQACGVRTGVIDRNGSAGLRLGDSRYGPPTQYFALGNVAIVAVERQV